MENNKNAILDIEGGCHHCSFFKNKQYNDKTKLES